MTEDQYVQLCESCDALLLQEGVGKARIATGWLHVLREHPLLLGRYEMLFAPSRHIEWQGRLWLKRLRYQVSYIGTRYRAWRGKAEPWWFSRSIEERPDILFLSHLLSPQQAGAADDFYFGNLPSRLSAEGIRVAVVLINHTSENGEELAAMWNSDPVPRVVLAGILGSTTERDIQQQLRKESSRLAALGEVGLRGRRGSETDSRDRLPERVRQQAAVEVLSGNTRVALRQSLQFEQLLERLKPRVLLATHEGHAWERLAFAAAHESACGTLCMGYIQGSLSELQHAVRRNLAAAFNPDRILTAGSAAKAQLAGSEAASHIPVDVLGSNRCIEPVSDALGTASTKQEKPGCLVVPEGIMEECCRLFSFSLECALALPAVNFIWRLHPLITFDMLRKAERRFNSLPGNIILSGIKIEEDIARSRWALYRGSTAIIQCGAAGLRPIYLNRPDELPFDALYELQEWRREVSTVEDFYRIVQTDCGADEQALYREAQSAMEYISSIYTRLNPEVLKNIVAAHGI